MFARYLQAYCYHHDAVSLAQKRGASVAAAPHHSSSGLDWAATYDKPAIASSLSPSILHRPSDCWNCWSLVLVVRPPGSLSQTAGTMTNPYAGSGGPPSFSPPSGVGLRRPSYATVAAGVAAQRAAALERSASYTNAASLQARGEQQPQALGVHSRPHSRSMEIDGHSMYGGRGRSGVWAGDGLRCSEHEDHPPFFTPSYLRQSRHVQRLHRAYDEHLSELQEYARLNPPKQPSLSTSSSTANLHKLNSPHMTRNPVQDVIERIPPPTEQDRSHPLPSSWSEEDKMNGLEILGEGTEVRFAGVTKTSDEAASIRSDHPMPKECGLYYYEVTILSRGKDGLIGIGFSAKRANLNRLPGWEHDSWAYHGDDGYSFACSASGKAYGPRFSSNDVIGCGVNFRTGNAFFTKNGVYLGKSDLVTGRVLDQD